MTRVIYSLRKSLGSSSWAFLFHDFINPILEAVAVALGGCVGGRTRMMLLTHRSLCCVRVFDPSFYNFQLTASTRPWTSVTLSQPQNNFLKGHNLYPVTSDSFNQPEFTECRLQSSLFLSILSTFSLVLLRHPRCCTTAKRRTSITFPRDSSAQ